MPTYRDRYGKLARRPETRRRTVDFKAWLMFGAIPVVVAGAILVGIAYLGTQTTLSGCTVDSKDRGVSITSDGDGNVTSQTNYRVYTDCGVMVVEDNLFFGKFNSADTYGSIQEGQTYDFKVVGWRNGFLSLFPNILETSAR